MPKSVFILAAMSGLPWDGWVLGFCWRVGIVTRVVFFHGHFIWWNKWTVYKWDLVTACEDGIYWLSRKTFWTQPGEKVWETLKRANVEVELSKDFHAKPQAQVNEMQKKDRNLKKPPVLPPTNPAFWTVRHGNILLMQDATLRIPSSKPCHIPQWSKKIVRLPTLRWLVNIFNAFVLDISAEHDGIPKTRLLWFLGWRWEKCALGHLPYIGASFMAYTCLYCLYAET